MKTVEETEMSLRYGYHRVIGHIVIIMHSSNFDVWPFVNLSLSQFFQKLNVKILTDILYIIYFFTKYSTAVEKRKSSWFSKHDKNFLRKNLKNPVHTYSTNLPLMNLYESLTLITSKDHQPSYDM